MREQGRSNRGLRLLGRVLIGIVVTLAVLVLLGLAWINTGRGKAWVLGQVLARAHELVPGLEIGRIRGFLPVAVRLERVRVKDLQGRPALWADQIDADPGLWALLRREIKLEELTIKAPALRLTRDAQGKWNLQQLIVKRKKPPRAWDVVVEKLELTGGQVTVTIAQQQRAQLHQLVLRADGSVHESVISANIAHMAFQYSAEGRRGRISALAHARATERRVDARLEAQATGLWAQEAVPIVATLQGPRQQLELGLRAGNEAQGQLQASATLAVRRVVYGLRASLKRFNPQALNARWPHGDLNLELSASGQGAPLQEHDAQLDARLSSSGLELAGQHVEELHAQLQTRGARWQLEKLQARGPGVSVQAQGGGTRQAFRLRTALEADRLGPLQLGKHELRAQGQSRLDIEQRTGGKLVVEGTTNVRRASYGKLTLRSLVAQLAGQLNLLQGTGALTLQASGPFALNEIRFRRANLEARAQNETLHVEGRAVPAAPSGRGLAPARLTARLPLQSAKRAPLRLARDKPIDVQASWPGVSLQRLGSLLGTKLALGGQLWMILRVEGTLDKPRVRAQVALRNGSYRKLRDLGAQLDLTSRPGRTSADLRASLAQKPALSADAVIAAGPRAFLEQQRWLSAPLDLVVHVHPLDVNRLAALAAPLAKLQSRLRATLRAAGSLAYPRLLIIARASSVPLAGERSAQATARFTGHVSDDRFLLQGGIRVDRQPLLQLAASTAMTPAKLFQGRSLRSFPLHVSGVLEPTRLAALEPFYPALRPLGGELRGTFSFAGALPALAGQALLTGADLRLKGQPLGNLRASTQLSARLAHVAATLDQRGGSATLAAKADEQGALRATFVANNLDLSSLRRLWPNGPLAEDKVSGKLVATGTVGETGSARVRRPASTPLARLLGREPIRGEVTVSNPRLGLYLNRPERKPKRPRTIEHLDDRLHRMRPFYLARFAVSEGELHLVDATLPGRPALKLHRFALTLENVASRREFMAGAPALLAFRTTVEQSGETTGFATFDPLTPKPLAAGRAVMRGLELVDVQPFLYSLLGARAVQGTFSCYVAFRLVGDQLSGGIKPIVTQAELEPIRSSGPLRDLAIETAELLGKIFGGKVQGRKSVATVIPIEGTLDQLDVQLLPALLTLIRNAFVVGIAANFANLPPPRAGQRQSIFTQARKALSKKSSPEAQPPKKR